MKVHIEGPAPEPNLPDLRLFSRGMVAPTLKAAALALSEDENPGSAHQQWVAVCYSAILRANNEVRRLNSDGDRSGIRRSGVNVAEKVSETCHVDSRTARRHHKKYQHFVVWFDWNFALNIEGLPTKEMVQKAYDKYINAERRMWRNLLTHNEKSNDID
jgi:hypothetical protein